MDTSKMRFEDLKAWKQARIMTYQIYKLCDMKPLSRQFSLSDQIRRASVSVMANLAEGFERVHKAEKIQLWNIARASAGEVRSLLYVILDNNLAEKEEYRPYLTKQKKSAPFAAVS